MRKKSIFIFLGSIISFVVTSISLIAIFFPDLFNLSKNKIPEISLSIESYKDIESFRKFVDLHIEKIAKLNLKLCDSDDNKDYFWWLNIDTGENYGSIETINDEKCYEEYINDPNKIFETAFVPCGGTSFNFDIVYWDKMYECPIPPKNEYDTGGFIVSGYYYLKKPGQGQGITAYYFERVDDKDLKLKQY